jgi:hypothetical protein
MSSFYALHLPDWLGWSLPATIAAAEPSGSVPNAATESEKAEEEGNDEDALLARKPWSRGSSGRRPTPTRSWYTSSPPSATSRRLQGHHGEVRFLFPLLLFYFFLNSASTKASPVSISLDLCPWWQGNGSGLEFHFIFGLICCWLILKLFVRLYCFWTTAGVSEIYIG